MTPGSPVRSTGRALGRSVGRSQRWALVGVVVLLAAAFAVREQTGSAAPRAPAAASPSAPAGGASDAELTALRAQARLEACPSGLGDALPDVVLPCLGGGPDVALRSAPPGRPTLVNVWASWCAPCADEVPELVEFSARAGDRVGIVGVLTTDQVRNGLAFSRDFGIRYPSVVDDDGEVLRAFRPGPPVTLFLDASGTVVHRRSGAFRDLAELERLVAEHLGVRL